MKINEEKISLIIPTMWRSDKILKMLPIYEECDLIKEVIIIDNDPKLTPNLKPYNKILYYTKGENIYVNPAWNLGYTLSSCRQVILANDDIIINDLDKVLNLLVNSNYDIVGISLDKTNEGLKIDPIDTFPANSYGCFIYIKQYKYIPEKYKIWYGDQFLFEVSEKRGLLKNSNVITNVSETLNSNNKELRKNIAVKEVELYEKEGFSLGNPPKKLKILSVLVNYGDEQIDYLKKVVSELKSFKHYDVTVIVNSNIPLNIPNIDKVNLFQKMENYQLLPLTCRATIIENINNYDIFIYGENDHLFKETHVNKHIEYSKILPKNRIPGLIQYEENDEGKFYPAYHADYDWDFESVESYDNKMFAHFTNVHQATFILTKEQLVDISKKHDFKEFFGKSKYSVKCKVNTDIYDFCGMKKMICISEFKDNLIHHLPNLYIHGENGRNKNQRSDNEKMNNSLIKLFKGRPNKQNDSTPIINGFYLNLSKRTDRKEKMEIEFKKSRHNISRFEAVDGTKITNLDGFKGTIKNSEKKQYATYLSHLNMLKLANNNKWESVLIFEDDITLSSDFDSRLDYLMKLLPKDWKIVYLGFNGQPNTSLTKINKWVYSVKNVYGCFGMLINGNFLNEFINKIETNKTVIDEVIRTVILTNYTCYAFIPFLLYVNDDYSDLWNKHRVITPIKNLYLPQVNFNNEYEINLKHPFMVKPSNELHNYILSIIIPTYDDFNLLVECLESVIKSIQNLKCEILVGIDGCQKTKELLKDKVFDERISFYYFNKNVGPYIIKNTLSLESKSDYILFFDSDDIMTNDLIVDIMSNKKNSQLIKPMYLDFMKESSNINNKIKTSRTYGEGVFGINKDLFLKMNGFEGWRCAADSELMGRLYKNKVKLTHTKRIGFYRRIHNNSLTQHPETNLKSTLRRTYVDLMKKKKTFGPLPNLITEYCEILNLPNIKINGNSKYSEVIEKKDNITNILTNVITLSPDKEKKKVEINYNQINKILEGKQIYNPKKNTKSEIVTQTKPTPIIPTQNSINKLKQEMFPKKPNRRGDLPNVFGNNQRRKGGFSI
jgi:GR25 family glycosyltransferase involved in LPS biosynthesis